MAPSRRFPTLRGMLQVAAAPGSSAEDDSAGARPVVRHLRQVLLWPLRLIPQALADDAEQRRAPWQLLREMGEDASPCREHCD